MMFVNCLLLSYTVETAIYCSILFTTKLSRVFWDAWSGCVGFFIYFFCLLRVVLLRFHISVRVETFSITDHNNQLRTLFFNKTDVCRCSTLVITLKNACNRIFSRWSAAAPIAQCCRPFRIFLKFVDWFFLHGNMWKMCCSNVYLLHKINYS